MIGFFDSGVGGLTILEEVHKRLPAYSTVYLGDTAHAPYGTKSHEELVKLTWAGIQALFKQGEELVIIACNSASASALREIQQTKLQTYPEKRVLGIIRPTVEFLAKSSYKNIAVLSTQATKESGAYVKEFAHLNPHIAICSHAAPRFAPLIEEGKMGTPELRTEVEEEIARMEKACPNVEAVLLACTHYPFVKNDIEASLRNRIPVLNQGEIVAASLEDYLARHEELERRLAKAGERIYLTTGDAVKATQIACERFQYRVNFFQMK